MKNISKLFTILFTSLLISCSSNVNKDLKPKRAASTSYTEETELTDLYYKNGCICFKLTNNDYLNVEKDLNFNTVKDYVNLWNNIKIYSSNDMQLQYKNIGNSYGVFGAASWGEQYKDTWNPQLWIDQDDNGAYNQPKELKAGTVFYIPKGTTFPSFQYVSNAISTPKSYMTTSDVAFVYTIDKTFEKCEIKLTSINDLYYVNNGNSISYLGFNIEGSDYASISSKDFEVGTQKIRNYTYRDLLQINGSGEVLLDTMSGASHDYHVYSLINYSNNNCLSIQVQFLANDDLVIIPAGTTFPCGQYLKDNTKTQIIYVIEYDTTFKVNDITGGGSFTKISTEPYYYENDLPVVNFIKGVGAYSNNITIYNEQEAINNNVPTGYIGSVATCTNVNRSFTLSYDRVLMSRVISMTFRFYVESNGSETDSYPEMRITNTAGVDWLIRYNKTTLGEFWDQWYEITLTSENTPKLKTYLQDDGYLAPFEFSVRADGKSAKMYLDSVKLLLKEADEVAPIITYNGEDTIYSRVGRKLELTATSYDEFELRNIPVTYSYKNLDGQAIAEPTEKGTYILVISSSDLSGNTAYKEVTLVLDEKDIEAPVFSFTLDTINVPVGYKVMMNIKAIDAIDGEVEVSYSWSSGAFDDYNRLVSGTHTLTLTATDLSNNIATKEVTFIVS